MRWFDAHLDLACLAENGRKMTAPLETCGGPWLPAGLTLKTMAEGNVECCLATVFTEAIDGDAALTEPQQYRAGDVEGAAIAGRRQIDIYDRWRKSNIAPSTRMGILIESADPIRSPDELSWWHAQSVVAIGMAWARSGRYAGGNTTKEGLTDLGRALAKEMDRFGLVHDVSHLSDKAFEDLLLVTTRRVVATHSNCRELLGGGKFGENQRHLRDGQIRDIIARDGVIGLNLYSAFLSSKCKDSGRATLADCIEHIEYVCEIAGDRKHVGLGSDMDGGFSAQRMPEGIDAPRDFVKLGEALRARGWNDDDVRGFAFENWARIFGPG